MPPDTLLADIATSILTEVADYLEDNDIEVPTTQYVIYGDPAVDFTEDDCASALIVAWRRFLVGSPGEEIGDQHLRCQLPRASEFEVWLLRCALTLDDQGNAPTGSDLNAEGVDRLIDAWMVSEAIYKRYKEGNLVPGGKDRPVGLGEQRPYGPQGGAAGIIQTVIVSMV